MKTKKKNRALRQVQRKVRALQDRGWVVEELTSTDAEGEPYRVTVVLALDSVGVTPEKGVL